MPFPCPARLWWLRTPPDQSVPKRLPDAEVQTVLLVPLPKRRGNFFGSFPRLSASALRRQTGHNASLNKIKECLLHNLPQYFEVIDLKSNRRNLPICSLAASSIIRKTSCIFHSSSSLFCSSGVGAMTPIRK